MKKTVNERWANQRFGRLYIVNAWVDGGVTRANCVCDCGACGEYRVGDIKSGNTASCGCYRVDNTRIMKRTHGQTDTALYKIWSDMKKRCYNSRHKAYARYGGRGIGMSSEWKNDFCSFMADMGERPTPDHEIDRINNDGPYSKENCRWATRRQNMLNTRRAMVVEYGGERVSLKDLSALTGVKYGTLYYRFKRGLPVLQA